MKDELIFTVPVIKLEEQIGDYEFIRFTTTRHRGTSTGEYASFNLGIFSGDLPENVRKNRNLLCKELRIDESLLFVPRQIHGDKIFDINATFFLEALEGHRKEIDGYDALITDVSGVAIGITTADCTPIVFYDPVRRVTAAAHAGWRGTAQEIVCKVVEAMIKKHQCDVKNIKATIFPCIGKDVYQVGQEVITCMAKTCIDIDDLVEISPYKEEKYYFDLAGANRRMLLYSGLLSENITMLNDCTYTGNENFFSARRQGYDCGRMVSGIIMKDLSSCNEKDFDF